MFVFVAPLSSDFEFFSLEISIIHVNNELSPGIQLGNNMNIQIEFNFTARIIEWNWPWVCLALSNSIRFVLHFWLRWLWLLQIFIWIRVFLALANVSDRCLSGKRGFTAIQVKMHKWWKLTRNFVICLFCSLQMYGHTRSTIDNTYFNRLMKKFNTSHLTVNSSYILGFNSNNSNNVDCPFQMMNSNQSF